MMFKANLLCFLILALIMGCSGSPKSESGIIGDYEFTMYDSSNSKIAIGNLTIQSHVGEKVIGTYQFTDLISEFSGYGTMRGKFDGKVNESEKMILINTNPGAADNNIYFNVKIEKNKLEGEWYYTGFRQNMVYNNVVLKRK